MTIKEKDKIVSQILPLLEGMKINDALELLKYAQGCICDFCTVGPISQDGPKDLRKV